MILDPAVTATMGGSQEQLAALRTEWTAWVQMLHEGAANVSVELGDIHKAWGSRYTPDLEIARRHIESAWRSLGYALDIIAGK